MKSSLIALTLLVGVLLSSGGLLVTHASNSTYGSQIQSNTHKSDPKLSLSLQGLIASAGSQTWYLAGGGTYGAQFGAETVAPGAVQYSLNAKVSGLTSTGTFKLSLTGQTTDGQQITVTGNGVVVGSISAMCFPNYDTSAAGTCMSTDSSMIPAFFEVAGTMSETVGTTTTNSPVLLLVETPIMNPWGSAIVISSIDPVTGAPTADANIIATYTMGTAVWKNVLLTSSLTGTYNGQPASGTLFQVSNAYENFVAGTEFEYGTVAFQAMTPSSLDSTGTYMGTSSVPTNPATMADCSAVLGTPTGTCTETGLHSVGTFTAQTGGHHSSTIQGKYIVDWPQPSVTFAGTVNASVTL